MNNIEKMIEEKLSESKLDRVDKINLDRMFREEGPSAILEELELIVYQTILRFEDDEDFDHRSWRALKDSLNKAYYAALNVKKDIETKIF